jgi:hypothetical protein
MEIQERPPSILKNVNAPLGDGARGLRALTTNTKKMSTSDPLGSSAGDSGTPTINARKCRWWPPEWC